MTGCRRFGTECKGLAFQILQLGNRFVSGDEDRLEILVFLALYQRNHFVIAADLCLDKGKTAKPHHVELVVDQTFDRRRIIGDRHEFHLHAEFLLQVIAKRLELALQFGGGFIRNGRDAKHLLCMDDCS